MSNFNVGDMVIVNDLAEGRYFYSKPTSYGIVTQVLNKNVLVRFSYVVNQPPNSSGDCTYEIRKDFLNHYVQRTFSFDEKFVRKE